jgi:hypothetical protein
MTWLFSKQRLVAPNILVCYTSSNGAATTRALNSCWGARNLKRIGVALKETHNRYGGITELLAVVWRKQLASELLELMPPQYAPQPRTGVVGIGDPAVLDWFRLNFRATPDPPHTLSAEDLEALSRAVGTPVTYNPPPYTIDEAALSVGAALSEGIRQAGGFTVGLPIQIMTVTLGTVRTFGITSTSDLQTWEDITVDRATLRLPCAHPPVVAKDPNPRSAAQLVR